MLEIPSTIQLILLSPGLAVISLGKTCSLKRYIWQSEQEEQLKELVLFPVISVIHLELRKPFNQEELK